MKQEAGAGRASGQSPPERGLRVAEARPVRAEQPLVHAARDKAGADPRRLEGRRRAEPLRRVDDERHAARAARRPDHRQVDHRAVAPMAWRQRGHGDRTAVDLRDERTRPVAVGGAREREELAALVVAQRLPLHHVGRVLVLEHQHPPPARRPRPHRAAQVVRRDAHRKGAAREDRHVAAGDAAAEQLAEQCPHLLLLSLGVADVPRRRRLPAHRRLSRREDAGGERSARGGVDVRARAVELRPE
mmetsp:Transcript_28285/g.92201  ORF Transcript_28285/g.92201 Transcript_28285/m.92201 type:complete len:245 (-) Transcript_28285:64-798(-)